MASLFICDHHVDRGLGGTIEVVGLTMDKLSIAKILSNPDQSGWVQIHDFIPQDQDKYQKRGRLLAVISVQNSNVEFGKEILLRIHEEYFASSQDSIFEALKNAVEKVSREFEEDSLVEITALAVKSDLVFCASSNGSQVYLFRAGSIVPILKSRRGETVSASGRIAVGDSLLLCSSKFIQEIPMGVIKGALESGNFDSLTEILMPMLHTKENGSTGALFVARGKPEVGQVQTALKLNWRSRFKKILLTLIDKLLEVIPEHKIIVRDETRNIEKKRKKGVTSFVGFLLIFILVISIGFGVKQKSVENEKKKYQSQLTQAQHEFEEASALAGLDTARAKELLLSSREIALRLKDQKIKDERLEELLKKISENIGTIAGIYETEPQVFLDLSLVTSGFEGTDMAFSEGRMLVLDSKGRKIIGVDLETKRTEVITGPDYLPDAVKVGAYADRAFVLSNDGIREIKKGGEAELVVKSSLPAGKVSWNTDKIFIDGFAGNLYSLSKEDGKIWRYIGLKDGFSEGQDWLSEGTQADFGDAISWAIDGNIWILKQNRILKFSQGVPQAFVVKGIEGGFSSARDIYTDEELGNLYILDSEHEKIFLLDKNGEYKGEYKNSLLKEAKKILVSEQQKKIVFLSGPKLYSIEIK